MTSTDFFALAVVPDENWAWLVETGAMSSYWVLLPDEKPDSQSCEPALFVHRALAVCRLTRMNELRTPTWAWSEM